LRFERGRGWVHGDGKLVKTRVDADGIERDDHASFPVPDGEKIEAGPRRGSWVRQDGG